jgi:hypothetical protein
MANNLEALGSGPGRERCQPNALADQLALGLGQRGDQVDQQAAVGLSQVDRLAQEIPITGRQPPLRPWGVTHYGVSVGFHDSWYVTESNGSSTANVSRNNLITSWKVVHGAIPSCMPRRARCCG